MRKVIQVGVAATIGLTVMLGPGATAMAQQCPGPYGRPIWIPCRENGVCERISQRCFAVFEDHSNCPRDCQCDPVPGDMCTQCVLKARPDVYSFLVGSWGYPTTCTAENAVAMLNAWCGALDPVGCNTVMVNTCGSACAVSPCGDACTKCTFEYRKDLLPYFMNNGYDMSCSNRDALRKLWNSWASPEEMAAVRSTCPACRPSHF